MQTATYEKPDKTVLLGSIIGIAGVVLGSLLYGLFGSAMIESAYNGQSFEFLNRIIADHRSSRPWADLNHYLTLGRLLFSRLLLASVFMQLIFLVAVKGKKITQFIREFLYTPTDPLNLAIFRIVVFYSLFYVSDVSVVAWYSQIPAELRLIPFGFGWFAEFIPINPAWATTAAILFLLASFTAMIGLGSRTSALTAVVLGVYVLGIPQLYGKVNHYHHLLWFAAILAVSRCGDALSCDAIIYAWRRADRGHTDLPRPSPAYGLPLRFVWLLIGGIYFFAGFWKLWSAGFDWALSDNFKFIMYQKWFELGEWRPIFRIDEYPVLYRLAAMGAVLFELSFIFVIFSKKWRLLAPINGILFHTGTRVFMHIHFQSLVNCYVAFFDWKMMLDRLGRHLYRDVAYVLYDGSCSFCRRTIAIMRIFDVFGQVHYLDALDERATKNHGLDWLDSKTLMEDMHIVIAKKHWSGYSAYRVLAYRIPVLWPLIPLLYIPIIAKTGVQVYGYVARSRTCNLIGSNTPKTPTIHDQVETRLGPIFLVGSLLLFGNASLGIAHMDYAWPLACYPTFEGLAPTESRLLNIVVFSSTGEARTLNQNSFGPGISIERFWGLMSRVLSSNDSIEREHRVDALRRLLIEGNSDFQNVRLIKAFELKLTTIPERRSENPLARNLLFELKL